MIYAMSNDSGKRRRPYRLKARAERQEVTRRRIAAAAASLHEEVGPARTTIAEVARRAGVQRPTVYNNFPDERELLAACQDHFLSQHPPPDPSGALALEDPAERLREVLDRMYGWYRSTEAMAANVERDRRLLPELDALLGESSDPVIDGLADELAHGFRAGPETAAKIRALVRLALDFSTWQRLAHEGLADADAAELMTGAALAAAGACD